MMALDLRPPGSRMLRPAEPVAEAGIGASDASVECGIRRKGGQPERGRGQGRASNQTKWSTDFASGFEAHGMGTSDTVVTQNRCLVPGAAKSLAVALEFVPALGAIADPPTFGFARDRPLADQAAG